MPRKTEARRRGQSQQQHASMRPRPDAAENVARTAWYHRWAREASMRPRPDAAENLLKAAASAFHWHLASMRPRPDAAENERARERRRGDVRGLQ